MRGWKASDEGPRTSGWTCRIQTCLVVVQTWLFSSRVIPQLMVPSSCLFRLADVPFGVWDKDLESWHLSLTLFLLCVNNKLPESKNSSSYLYHWTQSDLGLALVAAVYLAISIQI
jgi:hypothetical protein